MTLISIPPNIKNRLRDVLIRCGPFENSREVKAVFVDGRVSAWHNQVPEADTPFGRVDSAIDFLSRKFNETQDNALVLFLRVLHERANPGDSCHRYLAELTDELESVLKASEEYAIVSREEQILRFLFEQRESCPEGLTELEISEQFEIPQGMLKRHLRRSEESGIVCFETLASMGGLKLWRITKEGINSLGGR